jgi:hypothetical protein
MRATELAREFTRLGHEVTVVTQPRGDIETPLEAEGDLRIKEVLSCSYPELSAKDAGILSTPLRKVRRLLELLAEYPSIELMPRVAEALREEREYDLLVSVATPHPIHWGVAWARSRGHHVAETWVADCGDPYMGLTLDSYQKPFYFGPVEKWFCHQADYLSVPTEGAIEGYYPEFRDKIRVIPQGFDFSTRPNAADSVQHDVPTFAYAGGLAPKGVRSPVKLLDYLVRESRDFRFHLYATTGRNVAQSYAESSGGRVILHDPMPREHLLPELSHMDFVVNFDNGVASQTPSKLIDYALTGRPILNVAPESPDFDVLDEFLSGNYESQYVVPNVDRYDIRCVAQQFLDLCSDRVAVQPEG